MLSTKSWFTSLSSLFGNWSQSKLAFTVFQEKFPKKKSVATDPMTRSDISVGRAGAGGKKHNIPHKYDMPWASPNSGARKMVNPTTPSDIHKHVSGSDFENELTKISYIFLSKNSDWVFSQFCLKLSCHITRRLHGEEGEGVSTSISDYDNCATVLLRHKLNSPLFILKDHPLRHFDPEDWYVCICLKKVFVLKIFLAGGQKSCYFSLGRRKRRYTTTLGK